MNIQLDLDDQGINLLKAFHLLRREGETDTIPRSKYNYSKDVSDGLDSAVIVAVALWIARNFPEAPLTVEEPDG